VESDASGRVRAFHEKPQIDPCNTISTGVYLFKTRTLLELLQENALTGQRNLAKNILEANTSQLNCHSYPMNDYWEYLENLSDFHRVQFQLMQENHFEIFRSWGILTNYEFRGVGSAPPAMFSRTAEVSDVVAGAGCRIEGTVEHSILSPGVRVARGAVVRNSILMHDCIVDEGAVVDHTISDRDARFTGDCRVGADSEGNAEFAEHADYLGDLTLIGKGAVIRSGTIVARGTQLPSAAIC
jgi:glucose-1-phosphate adenylyltransferase